MFPFLLTQLSSGCENRPGLRPGLYRLAKVFIQSLRNWTIASGTGMVLNHRHLKLFHGHFSVHCAFTRWAVRSSWSNHPHTILPTQTSKISRLCICCNWGEYRMGSGLGESFSSQIVSLLMNSRASISCISTSKSWDQLVGYFQWV